MNRNATQTRVQYTISFKVQTARCLATTGEIRLCPADVPNQWMSVLQSVTPAVISAADERAREMSSLQERASRALRGAHLSRGLSCSKNR